MLINIKKSDAKSNQLSFLNSESQVVEGDKRVIDEESC